MKLKISKSSAAGGPTFLKHFFPTLNVKYLGKVVGRTRDGIPIRLADLSKVRWC